MTIGKHQIGYGYKTFIIAELGINHNGKIEIVKELIDAAKESGCDAVKFQKRTVDVVYSAHELALPRESPYGNTNGDLKRGLELSHENYKIIDGYCKSKEILWFASPWDTASVDFLESFKVPCYKIAAAGLTDRTLLEKIKETNKPVFLSCGMSDEKEVDAAVEILGKKNLILMHCRSVYPAPPKTINLRAMLSLKEKYTGVLVGYSGHESDTVISPAAVALGACAVERHLTLDRNMWGSDHKASVQPDEMKDMVKNITIVEAAMGSPEIRCLPEEDSVKHKLRRIDDILKNNGGKK